MSLSRGKIQVVDGLKTCECGTKFPVEFNSRKQMTSRKLCDKCRIKRQYRRAADLPDIAGVPRCAECLGLVGLKWGTITHLNAAGLCTSCAKWAAKRRQREAAEARGAVRLGGLWFGPARPLRSMEVRR